MMVAPRSTEAFDERDEYPKVTQEDMDRATFRVGLDVVIERSGEGSTVSAPQVGQIILYGRGMVWC
jgi:hypothetical protein